MHYAPLSAILKSVDYINNNTLLNLTIFAENKISIDNNAVAASMFFSVVYAAHQCGVAGDV